MGVSASAIRAGGAFLELFADDSQLNRTLKSAAKKVKHWGTVVTGVGAGIAGIGTAITAPFLSLAKAFADAGSELNDMSTRTGVSVESLSALGYAAQQAGTDLASVEGGIRRMQRTLVMARTGNQAAAVAFAQLGLSVEALSRLSPDQQFVAVARALARVPDPTARAAAAMMVFGRAGATLLPMIGELGALVAQAHALGLVMSTEDARAADALGDAMDTLTAVVRSAGYAVGAALAPMLIDVATSLALAAKTVADFVRANRPLIVTLFQVGAALAAAGVAIAAVGAAIVGTGVLVGSLGAIFGAVSAAFTTVATVIGFILSPLGAVVAGLAGLTVWFFRATTAGGAALGWLRDRFDDLKTDALGAFDGIADAMMAGNLRLAGQVLWAFLKVEWLRGTGFLKAVWRDWSDYAVSLFGSLQTSIAGIMTDLWAGMQTGWVDVVAYFQDGWTGLVAFLMKSVNTLVGEVEKLAAQFRTAFTGGYAEAAAEIDRTTQAANDAIDAGMGGTTLARQKDREKRKGGIEADRQAARQALADQQAAADEARMRASQAAAAGDADALEQAIADLNDLEIQARDARLKVASGGKPGLPGVPDLGEAIGKAADKVDATGSFSASALKGLGYGESLAEDQLKEQKKTNKQLEDLNRKVDQGGLVFGD